MGNRGPASRTSRGSSVEPLPSRIETFCLPRIPGSGVKAAVLNKIGAGFDIEDVHVDTPACHEVLVEVRASGLCHSDLHLADGDYGIPLPAVFGHELAGVVVDFGAAVRDFRRGDRVVGSLLQYCGACSRCISGRTWMCLRPEATLRNPQGAPRLRNSTGALAQVFGVAAFAELALVHENQLAPIPADVPFAPASLLGCGVVTGAGAVINTAGVRVGETVAVIGVGGVGLNAIWAARHSGASRVIAIDTQSSKAALATTFGATDFVDARQSDAVAEVRALTGDGVDHAFEVVGSNDTLRQATAMTRKGGGMYVVGLPRPGTELCVDVHSQLIRRQISITGVYMGSTNTRQDIPMYAELYLQGRLDLDKLVSQEISIDQINDAYRDLAGGHIARSVITSF
jgi:S-(hydroxymethyl)glutathione dehydrogenase/alcohol dehydrogenase